MAERTVRRTKEWARWTLLGAAVVVLVVFLLAQRTQDVDVSYGQSPSQSGITEDDDVSLSDATVPSVPEMKEMIAADPVVRLPGSIARWDEQAVREVIGDSDVRILVAPPGLDKAERRRVMTVEADLEETVLTVVGTRSTGGLYVAVADRITGWRSQFATGDITGHLVRLISSLEKREDPELSSDFPWREPTGAELDAVAADLRTDGVHVADGATLERVPEESSAAAFPDEDALYVALPMQEFGEAVPRYGPALTRLFPDRPVVVMYGSWIEYHGPNATDFARLSATVFYAHFADRLSRYDYPQTNVLGVWLDRVTDVRYAGLFDRPLPYVPVDPLTVTLPALPWLFTACVVGFVALSFGPLSSRRGSLLQGPRARLAGLTALTIEVSGLTDERSDPSLTRGIGKLDAAREALESELPARQVRRLLDDAENELDDTARLLGRDAYRPRNYLQGRLR
ncbi:hypothetical protein [Prauserella cavernicola]|uniref:DUF4350 domain-containing protein n=1 Tax=Prauserella cavernicola TaxID=2800127 RepID=A0A934QPD1_9PSEU|nr:hypothetical protein [Prauserella cavernicola]MBK1783588.1 hypothetical protein [Prauserella cavernicola]